MITAGIDLAAQPERTAACTINWDGGQARVVDLEPRGVKDGDIRAFIAEADWLGIDVPLGWPEAFVAAVSAHRIGLPWPGEVDTTELRMRATDKVVHKATGRPPLSVSTDRIGVAAFRAARLLSGEQRNRAGGGSVVEVYPAAALRMWQLDPWKTKGATGAVALGKLVSDFRGRTASWLRLSNEQWSCCEASDDAFDAVVAALVARAAATGLCDQPPPDLLSVAEREGWIMLPRENNLHLLA